MAKKDVLLNENDDIWAYPGNDEDEASAQDGTIIREYHLDSIERMMVNYQMASYALLDLEDEAEKFDNDCCDADEEID